MENKKEKEAVSVQGVVLEPQKDIEVFNKYEAERQAVRQQVIDMKVQDEKDTHGRQIIKDFKNRVLVKLRQAVIQAHKDKKAPYLEGGKIIDKAKRELVSNIEKMEAHLDKQIAIVDNYEREQLRIKREKEEARVQAMADKLKAIDVVPPMSFLEKCTDEEFSEMYEKEKEKYETFVKAKEEERKREEEERKKFLAKQAELKAKEEALKAKEEAIEKAEREARQKEIAKQKAENDALKAKEDARVKQEEKEKEEARKKSEDAKLFDSLMVKFPTHALAINEIIRLGKLIKNKGEK